MFKNLTVMIRAAEQHADDGAKDRTRATEYYRGEMADLKADEGRSSVVSKEVRAYIKKAMPSIMRTMFAGSEVVEFEPVNQGDEEAAQQASDYVNYVIWPEIGGRKVAFDVIHDALLLRNGILRWWWEEKTETHVSKHSGLTEDELAQLAGADGVEVVEASKRPEMIETPEGPQEITLHDVKVKRTEVSGCVKACAVPRERFLIDPDATEIDCAKLVGEKTTMTRGELVAMGYDKDRIYALSKADETDDDDRRDDVEDQEDADPANDEIDYFDLYVRVDDDGDGIAELRHVCIAGGLREENILVNEECDYVQFTDVCAQPQPHQWEGISFFDDLMEFQKVKTALKRQTLDNIYWQNNAQPIVDPSAVLDMGAVMNPEFGRAIELAPGRKANEVVTFSQVPFVAGNTFQMIEFLDAEAQDVTGINDASAGLAPDALQNMTAKASAMIEQGGIGQTELIVHNLAEGFRRFFKGILRLIVQHQDKPRMIRLRDKWVPMDPRHWNASMDATVNVGLGAGTRERDMQVVQALMMMQEKLLAAYGPDNPFVSPENVNNALAKYVESMGLKSPHMFFTEADPQQVAAKLAEAKSKPDPEAQKLQMQAQVDMQKAKMDVQAKTQIEQAKMQMNRDKEQAQMEADLVVRDKEIQAEALRQQHEFTYKQAEQERQIAWEREKLSIELQAKREDAERARANAAFDKNFGTAAE